MAFRRSIIAALAILAIAGPAMADNLVIKDATGATKTTATKTVGGVEHPKHIMEGMNGSTPKEISVDDDGAVAIQPGVLATETKLEAVRALLAGGIPVTLSGGATAANQTTGNGTLASILSGVLAATPQGTNTIGDVGSASFSASCSVLTLPGTGGTYASGDLAADSATAGSVTPLSCVVARYSGGPISVTKARLLTSTTGLTGASFRVHAYTASPTVTNGNDGVFLSTASGHFCKIDVTVDLAFSDGAEGLGAPTSASTCTRVLSATQTIYLLVEARGAYAWTAAQTLTITLEGYN